MFGILYKFFLANQLKNKKTFILGITGFIPFGIAILLTGLHSILNNGDITNFPNFAFLLYLHFEVERFSENMVDKDLSY